MRDFDLDQTSEIDDDNTQEHDQKPLVKSKYKTYYTYECLIWLIRYEQKIYYQTIIISIQIYFDKNKISNNRTNRTLFFIL